ncbi:MAG: hypothetical protein CMI30_05205 [Opitutae bacterium]|nr:hypothetical protein [Opitutae bacterium]
MWEHKVHEQAQSSEYRKGAPHAYYFLLAGFQHNGVSSAQSHWGSLLDGTFANHYKIMQKAEPNFLPGPMAA